MMRKGRSRSIFNRYRKVPGVLAGRLQMLGWELELGPLSGGVAQGEGFGTQLMKAA